MQEKDPVSQQHLSPVEQQLAYEMSEDFCREQCPAKESLEERGLACSFIIREALKGEDRLNAVQSSIFQVTNNTWLQCVGGVRRRELPIILLTNEDPNFEQIQ